MRECKSTTRRTDSAFWTRLLESSVNGRTNINNNTEAHKDQREEVAEAEGFNNSDNNDCGGLTLGHLELVPRLTK